MEVEISERYVASKKDYWDYYSTMKTSFDKGREEGREEGRKEGREEGEHIKALDTARKMRSDGMNPLHDTLVLQSKRLRQYPDNEPRFDASFW